MIMETIKNDKTPDFEELEKELKEFLSKRFGGEVKIVSPLDMPKEIGIEETSRAKENPGRTQFHLKPQELVSYLDEYVVQQDAAKAILATKICTHFNRIQLSKAAQDTPVNFAGAIKNNVLLIGPTGVGKTYLVKLIAKKLGVPFVKGDATKFSETGYVGGDVEDLVRDLVREADGDIELAQNGIIYIDEIDKIASSKNFVGSDISRTGVQRALLKPMEETEVELKVPHDPIAMIQEIDRYRKTGKREQDTINTKNILFIMSGAFSGLDEIIKERLSSRKIGFGATLLKQADARKLLHYVTSEDLIRYGFESEFAGRLPVTAVLDSLTEEDLYTILKNPNNPVVLGKKLDFYAYGIHINFEDAVLRNLAKEAGREKTGARGLVSAIERALLQFEKILPSTELQYFPVTEKTLSETEIPLEKITRKDESIYAKFRSDYRKNEGAEKKHIKKYLTDNKVAFSKKHSITLTSDRIELAAEYYVRHIADVSTVIRKIKTYADDIKNIELYFYKNQDINIVMEEDAIDYLIKRLVDTKENPEVFYQELTRDFEHGLKLVRERTGRNRFFITKEALKGPEAFISNLLRDDIQMNLPLQEEEKP